MPNSILYADESTFSSKWVLARLAKIEVVRFWIGLIRLFIDWPQHCEEPYYWPGRQNGQKMTPNFRLRFEPILCLVPTGARHNKFGSTANLQETAVRPTVFSNRDTFLFYLKRYLSILLLPVVSTCNTSVYARMRIPYTVRGSTSVLNIKKERF